MTLEQIVALARRMATTLSDGFRRAAHYLRSLNFTIDQTLGALRGA
jgi:hypothetical protein